MIFIIDEISKANIIKEITPYVKDYSYFENIIITGHQGMESAVTRVKSLPDKAIAEFRNRSNPHGKRLVLLALEPLEDFGYLQDGNPFRGYNEFTTIRYIFKHLDLSRVKLLIKPHPRHGKGVIEKFISENAPTDIFDFEIIQDYDLEILIAASDEVLGMTSTVLVTALKCGKQIRSFQINRNKNGEKALNHYIEPYVILE